MHGYLDNVFIPALLNWWISLQPGWRLTGEETQLFDLKFHPANLGSDSDTDEFVRRTLAARLDKGGKEGLSLILVGINWWACRLGKKEIKPGGTLDMLVRDVDWVIRKIIVN